MPGCGRASPSISVSMPAMIRSSVDLPEPFRPSTPILAPGKKRQRDVAQDDALRRDDLADAIHGVNVLGHGIAEIRGGRGLSAMPAAAATVLGWPGPIHRPAASRGGDGGTDTCVVAGERIARYGFPDGHPFGPDRHDAFLREAGAQGSTGACRLRAPRRATRAELERFHDPGLRRRSSPSAPRPARATSTPAIRPRSGASTRRQRRGRRVAGRRWRPSWPARRGAPSCRSPACTTPRARTPPASASSTTAAS